MLREDCRRVLEELVIAAEFKFLVHRNKGSWDSKSLDVLLRCLQEEVEELKEAVAQKDREAVLSELGDITNFCAIILDIAQKRGL